MPTPDPRPQDVEHHLEKILASEPFAASGQISAFLKYVVRETLAGRAGSIKSYSIAIDCLGRPPSFDPQKDPVVRVVANRLRQALAAYYAGAGADDPVRIVMTPGTYVPTFETADPAVRQPAAPVEPVPAAAADRPSRPSPRPVFGSMIRFTGSRTAAAVGALVLLAVVVVAGWILAEIKFKFAPEGGILSQPAPTENFPPTAAVTVVYPENPPEWFSETEVVAAIEVVLNRFDELRLLNISARPVSARQTEDLSDYPITVTMETNGDAVRIFARVIRGRDSTGLWSRTFFRERPADLADHDMTELVGEQAAVLASPNGVILADLAQAPDLTEPAKCLSQAVRVFATRSTQERGPVTDCLEKLAAAESTLPTVWALLAVFTLPEPGSENRPVDEARLKTAHEYARRAIEIAPASARAHQAMSAYYRAADDHANARQSAEKALSLNPYDLNVLADTGSYLVARGALIEGMALLSRVEELALHTPAWVDVHYFIGATLTGASATALRAAGRLRGQQTPLSLVAVALTAKSNGDQDTAARAVRDLVRLEPEFASNPGKSFLRRGFDHGVATAMVEQIKGAGLAGP